jgi:glutamate--cysteine ligase
LGSWLETKKKKRMQIREKIERFILSNIVEPENRKIGIEEEFIIYNSDMNRIPVNKGSEFCALDLLEIINEKSKNNGHYTLEPGGQLEWASPPLENLNQLNNSLLIHKSILFKLVKKFNLKVISLSTEPIFKPKKIKLINDLKYRLMDARFKSTGNLGIWMMRNSASIQINFDVTSQKDFEEMAFIADALHPVASYIFSNSPFKLGKPVGTKNLRSIIWENTDKDRCGNLFDHKIYSSKNLIKDYISYVLKTPSLFKINKYGSIKKSNCIIEEELEKVNMSNRLSSNVVKFYLQQIFTNVRLKHVLEIRGSDRTPFGYELAPAAFWTGLLTNNNVKNVVLNEIKQWTKEDRVKLNLAAHVLDSSQKGPENKSFQHIITWASDLAIQGLKNRNFGEDKYLIEFINTIKKKGPYTIQLQKLDFGSVI